jgi:hypothetical protein
MKFKVTMEKNDNNQQPHNTEIYFAELPTAELHFKAQCEEQARYRTILNGSSIITLIEHKKNHENECEEIINRISMQATSKFSVSNIASEEPA